MNSNSAVKVFFGCPHFHGNRDHLDHFTRFGCNNMAAQNLSRGLTDDEFHQHSCIFPSKGGAHRAETAAIDLDRFLLARRLFSQADGAKLRLGKDRAGDQVVIHRRRVRIEYGADKGRRFADRDRSQAYTVRYMADGIHPTRSQSG